MRKIVYDNGEMSIERRQGTFEISNTKKGLKLETYSLDWDSKDFIYYVACTDEYNHKTNWEADYCIGYDGTVESNALHFKELIEELSYLELIGDFRESNSNGIIIYRTISK